MTTNVQRLGALVLARAKPTLRLAHAGRADVPSGHIGRWQRRTVPLWSLDWAGPNGFDQRVEPRGGPAREFARPPRSWALIAPESPFGERFRAPEPRREYLYFGFALGGALAPLTGRAYALVLDPEDRLPPLVRAMSARLARGTPHDAIAAHGLLLQILAEVAIASQGGLAGDERRPWRIRSEARERSPELLERVDALLLRSLSAPPSRLRIAMELGMSQSALAHRFRTETGMGLRERARWLRVREAKARLVEPGVAVKEVSRALGFTDQAYFARVFRAITGLSPQEFVRQVR
jgi:AraC-like DNA-binding protein